MKKIVGILGGMGPLATSDLFNKIILNTNANCDQEHIHLIIDNNTNIKDRTTYILNKSNQEENPLEELIKSANRLKEAGANKIIVPCNTAHYFLEDVQKATGVEFISMIEATIMRLKKDYKECKNIAVISTTGTKQTKLYENLLLEEGFNVLEFSARMQKDIMFCIYDGVKKGKTDEAAKLFQSIIDKIELQGADILIAACTEIPILIQKVKSNKAVIDPTLELALKAIEYAKS